jgi:tetratricopeptide (TPR) repeat protein
MIRRIGDAGLPRVRHIQSTPGMQLVPDQIRPPCVQWRFGRHLPFCLLLLAVLLTCGCTDQKKLAEKLLHDASEQQGAEQFEAATESLNQAIALNPNLAEAWYQRGLIHARQNRSAEALHDLKTALRINPQWADAWYAQGMLLRSAGQRDAALKSYTESIRLNPKFSRALLDRSEIYQELQQHDLALRDLNVAIESSPAKADLRLHRAQILLADSPDDAIEDLSAVLENDTENVQAWLQRGIAWSLIGDSDRALTDLNVACRLNSGDHRPWLERGRILRNLGQYDDAISDLSQAAKLKSSDADCLYELAMACRSAGNSAVARTHLQQALNVNPQHIASAFALCELLESDGQPQQALEVVEKLELTESATISDVLIQQIHLVKSRLLLSLERYEDALAELLSPLTRNPNDRTALQLRAQALQRLNRSAEAVADYTRLISIASDPNSLLKDRAALHLKSGQYNDAIEDLTSVLKQDPANAELLLLRAEAFRLIQQPDKAISDLTQAMIGQPENAALLKQRATLYEEIRDDAAALNDRLQAVRLEPGNDSDLQHVLRDLKNHQRHDEAIALLTEVESRRPSPLTPELLLQRCELRLSAGQRASAEQDLQHLVQSGFVSNDLQLLRAKLLLEQSQPAEALDALNQVTDSSDLPEVRQLKGVALSQLGQHGKALVELSKALDVNSDHVATRLQRAETLAALADWQAALSDVDVVLENLSAADQTPQMKAARQLRAVSLFHLEQYPAVLSQLAELEESGTTEIDIELLWIKARSLAEVDQRLESYEVVRTLLERSPGHLKARALRAQLAEQHGEYDQAINDLTVVLQDTPSDPDALRTRGLLWLREGRYQSAIDDFSALLVSEPDQHEVLYRRGLAYYQLKQYSQAEADLKRTLTIQPASAESLYVLGNIAAAESRSQEALEYYRKTVESNPRHAAAWYNRGNLQFNLEQYQEAVEAWTRAIDSQPNMFRAFNNRAAAYVKLDRPKEAAEDYERTLELSPGFARAWDNYAWLLATTSDEVIRDTTRAVFLARRACELTNFTDWSCQSTLAACYAEAGDLEQAISWAKKSLEIAPTPEKPAIEEVIRTYEATRSARRTPPSTAVRNSQVQRR